MGHMTLATMEDSGLRRVQVGSSAYCSAVIVAHSWGGRGLRQPRGTPGVGGVPKGYEIGLAQRGLRFVGSGFAELRGLTPKGANDDSNKNIHGATIPGECFLSYFVVIDAWNHLGGVDRWEL